MTHALTFSPQLAKLYINEQGEKVGPNDVIQIVDSGNLKKFPHIVHPKIKAFTEEYYGCKDNNQGIPLAFKDKAHFHQQILADTTMRPMAEQFDDRVSVFMIALYKTTGWYIVDDALIEQNLWGKGKGCKFLQLECKDDKGELFEEYCSVEDAKNKIGCDFYHKSPATCVFNKSLGDVKCPWRTPFNRSCDRPDTKKNLIPEIDEFYGKNGKCIEYKSFDGSNLAGCFESECNMKEKSITIKIGDKGPFTASYQSGSPVPATFKANPGPGELVFNFPNFERFCFYDNHPIVSKPFRVPNKNKKKNLFKKKTK